MCNLVGHLATTQHRTGALTNAHGIASSVDMVSEKLLSLDEQLTVGYEASTYINNVNVVDDLFCSRDGLKVLALGDNGTCDAGILEACNPS